MWLVVPFDATPADRMKPVSNGMIYVGVLGIACAFAPSIFSEGGHTESTPMDARNRRIWGRIKLGILVFGLGLIVSGTLIQFYWLTPAP